MLEELTPQQLVGWRAARYVVPLEDGWRQAGTIAAAAHNGLERYMAARSGRRFVDKTKLRSPDDYIPHMTDRRAKSIVVNQESIDSHQAAMERRYLKK